MKVVDLNVIMLVLSINNNVGSMTCNISCDTTWISSNNTHSHVLMTFVDESGNLPHILHHAIIYVFIRIFIAPGDSFVMSRNPYIK